MIEQTDSWLQDAKDGNISWDELAERILQLGQQNVEEFGGPAHVPDSDRQRRCGFGEVIFGEGKSAEAITSIAQSLLDRGESEVLVTRISEDHASFVANRFDNSLHDPVGSTMRLSNCTIQEVRPLPCPKGFRQAGFADRLQDSPESSNDQVTNPWLPLVAVVTAGSTDRQVAQESLATLRWMGVDAELICDVGVAGPYRLLKHLPLLRKAAVIVVVAGMEGALASVMGGLVASPVVAVPTSVGYGFNLEGVTTLLSMMSSCAASVTTVNIDAGFKGGYVAGLMAHKAAEHAAALSGGGHLLQNAPHPSSLDRARP